MFRYWIGIVLLSLLGSCSRVENRDPHANVSHSQAVRASDGEDEKDSALCEAGTEAPAGSIRQFLPGGIYVNSSGPTIELHVHHMKQEGVEGPPVTVLSLYECGSEDYCNEDEIVRSVEVVETVSLAENKFKLKTVNKRDGVVIDSEELIMTLDRRSGWSIECASFTAADGTSNGPSKTSSLCSLWSPGGTMPLERVAEPDSNFAECGSMPVPADVLAKCKVAGEGYCLNRSECRVMLTPISPKATEMACSDVCVKNPLAEGCSTCGQGTEACGFVCCPTQGGTHQCQDNKCLVRKIGGTTGSAPGSSGFDSVFACDEQLLEAACTELTVGGMECMPTKDTCSCQCG